MNGTLEQTTTGWALRFRRRLRHSPAKVWAAFTDPAQRKAWFPDTMIGEIEPGATLRFQTGYASIPEFGGTVLAVESERLLEFTWGEDTLRFEIEPTPEGCMLTLLDSISELGKAARDGAGWHVCLDQLADALDGAEGTDGTAGTGATGGTSYAEPAEQRWADVHPGYVAAFGPQAATIGPPEL